MTMELKLFTDLIDTLDKVAGGLKVIANLSRAERETTLSALHVSWLRNGRNLSNRNSHFANSCNDQD